MNTTALILRAGALVGVITSGAALIWLGENPVEAIKISENRQYPDKLGWMDDATFTEADRHRVAEITGTGYPGNDGHLRVIRGIQAGKHSDITRRDFELLRQDLRRARVAYPDINPDKLFRGVWLYVDMSARIPDAWNKSHNGDSTQGSDGKWYIDGGVYTLAVSPEYPNRASAAEAEKYFRDIKAKRLTERLERKIIAFAWSGSGGSLSVLCADGQCVVRQTDEWASKGKRYTFPFIVAEWVDDPGTMEKIKALPSFKEASIEEIEVTPSGVSFETTWSSYPQTVPYKPGMTLMPGQSTIIGVTVPFKLNGE